MDLKKQTAAWAESHRPKPSRNGLLLPGPKIAMGYGWNWGSRKAVSGLDDFRCGVPGMRMNP